MEQFTADYVREHAQEVAAALNGGGAPRVEEAGRFVHGAGPSKESILSMTDPKARRRAIEENIDLFR